MQTTIDTNLLDSEYLKDLKFRIEKNKATLDEYEKINDTITSLGAPGDYFTKELHKYGISGFPHYYNERQKDINERNKFVEGVLLGLFSGAVAALIGYAARNR